MQNKVLNARTNRVKLQSSIEEQLSLVTLRKNKTALHHEIIRAKMLLGYSYI